MKGNIKIVALLVGWIAVQANADHPEIVTGLNAAGDPIKLDPVTEAEYAARETARPPAPTTPAQNTGTTMVRTEAELTAALDKGGDILVPGVTLTVTKRAILKTAGTRLRGNGAGNSRIVMGDTSDDRVIYPVASDCTVSDLTLSGGPWRVSGIRMDGGSRGADRFTVERVTIESVSDGIWLDGAPVTDPALVLEDFTFRDSTIRDFSHGGVTMAWEILRARFERFLIRGRGRDSLSNAMWMGLGMADSFIVDGAFEEVGRHGIEVFYPHTAHSQAQAYVTKTHPQGAGLTIANLQISKCGGFGASFAGCKSSTISNITTRNTTWIGVEFVDEDSSPSRLSAHGIKVFNNAGIGVSIDKVKTGRFSDFLIDTVTVALNGAQFGTQIYAADDITISGWTFTGCGPSYLFANGSTRTTITGNEFVAKAGEAGDMAFHIYGGDAYFHGNILRGNATHPMRTVVNSASVMTSPTSAPITAGAFEDANNYRGKRYLPK